MVAALALAPRQVHPAVRRRLPAALQELDPHEVILRPFDGIGPSAMIVTASEADFVGAILDDLGAADLAVRLAARRGRRARAGTPRSRRAAGRSPRRRPPRR